MIPTMRIPIALCLLVLFAACGGNAPVREDSKAVEASRRIRTMEDSLFRSNTFDRKAAQSLLDVYLAYERSFPSDSLAPEYAFRAANQKKTMGDPQGSLQIYDRIISNYPGWRKMADVYYLRAFTIDDGLKQKGEAKKAYEQVIEKFPDDPYAAQAAQMIVNLQFTDEELIERFRRMNPDSLPAGQAGAQAVK